MRAEPLQPGRPPGSLAVFALHVRAVGFSLRPWLIGGAILLGLALVSAILTPSGTTAYPMALNFLTPVTAALSAFGLWTDRRLFDAGDLGALPVERSRHALLIVAAGAVWVVLAAAVPAAVLNGTAGGAGRLWTWAVPVGAGLTAYLYSSALAVAARHPVRWAAALAALLTLALLLVAGSGASARLLPLVYGDVGLDRLLTGGVGSGRPDPTGWLAALSAWLGLGVLVVIVASYRLRER